MKLRLVKIAAAAAILTMLSGCGETNVNDNLQDAEPGMRPEVSVTEEAGDKTEPTVFPEEDSKVPAVPLLPEKETILNTKEAWEESENLYAIRLPALEGVAQSEVYRIGNDLLMTYYMYDRETQLSTYRMKRISFETGEVLYENELGSLTYEVIQVLDRHIAVNDLGEGKCYLFDYELNPVGTYDLPGGMFCLSRSGDTAYQFTYDQGVLKIDLSGGKKEILLDNVRNCYLHGAKGLQAAFSFTDEESLLRCNAVLNLQSGEISVIDSPYTYSSLDTDGENWLGMVEGGEASYVLSDGKSQKIFERDILEMAGLHKDSGQVMIMQSAETGVSFEAYDIAGNCVSVCEAEKMNLFEKPEMAWYEEYNGYIFTLMDQNGQDHLLFWNISGEPSGEELDLCDVFVSTTPMDGVMVSQQLFDRAKEVSEKYDVQILIADQCDTEFTDHTAELLLEEAEISQALNTLDEVLGQYPAGFFTQLKHDSYREIEIQVLGTLKKDYSTEDTTYISGGFVNASYPGKLLMALDARASNINERINPLLASTVYHELSHIIDRRLLFDSMQRADAYYSEDGWRELNPAGFEYNGFYYGTLEPKYADYFVDAYACSYETEDRARVLECAMAGQTEIFQSKKGLIKKLEYYCDAIRDSFDTDGWPEELLWEKTLNAVR